MWDGVEGLRAANDSGAILHAWKAGPDTMALRKQLEAMPDGGVYAIVIPEAPYRCPPGPYERASVIQTYFDKHKPKSKVLILDANPDVTSKGPLFKKAWNELHPGRIEYRAQHKAVAVDAQDEDGEVRRAKRCQGRRAQRAAADARRCHRGADGACQRQRPLVPHALHELRVHRAEGHPRAGRLDPGGAGHAEVGPHGESRTPRSAPRRLSSMLSGFEVNPNPMLTNVCMSYVDHTHVIHVASVHEYITAEKTFKTVGGSGGVSDVRSDLEATYADAWAKNIWADALM